MLQSAVAGVGLAELAPWVFAESKIISLFLRTEAGGLNQAAVVHHCSPPDVRIRYCDNEPGADGAGAAARQVIVTAHLTKKVFAVGQGDNAHIDNN